MCVGEYVYTLSSGNGLLFYWCWGCSLFIVVEAYGTQAHTTKPENWKSSFYHNPLCAMKCRWETSSYESKIKVHSPQFSGAVIACNILKEREGIAPPVYFLGSGTCCSEGGIYVCGVPSTEKHFHYQLQLSL